jgi:hypothetical protein
MVDFPWRATDPPPERLAEALSGLPMALLGDLNRPHAVVYGASSEAFDGIVCWWEDAIGRRHWFISHKVYPFAPDGVHPLECIAPPGSFVCQERGGQREWLAICGCGVFGPPEKIAWMGERCGACHDRLQEGLPTPGLGNAFGSPMSRLLVLPSGAIVGLEGRATRFFPDSRDWRLRFFGSLGAHAPQWETIVPEFRDAVVVGERVVLLANEQLWWLNLAKGQQRSVPGMPAEPIHALAVQGDRLWLAQTNHLTVHEATPSDGWRSLARYRYRHGPGVHLDPAPGGQLALVHLRDRLEVIDPFRGQVVLTHRLGVLGQVSGPIWLPSSDLVARTDDSGFDGFLRWRGLAERTPRGWMSRLLGSDRPERVACPGYRSALHVDADGRLVARTNEGYALHNNETLQQTCQFRLANASHFHGLHFHPNGDLYFFSPAGLVVWPWREMTR